MVEWIILTSICIQLTAAVMAARFFKENPAKGAWLFVCIAILLMVFRRFFGLIRITTGSGEILETVSFVEESIGLGTSLLLLLGVYRLGFLFRFVQNTTQKLITSEKRYRAIFHNVSDAILIIGREGNILDANSSAEKLFGFSIDKLRGSHLSLFSAPDQIEGTSVQEIIHSGIQNSGKSHEWILIGEDGRRIEAEVRASRLVTNGEEGILCVFRDRTREKQAERELRKSWEYLELVLDRNPMPIFVIDQEGRVALWNTSCENLTGISRTEIIGKKPGEGFGVLYPGREIPPATLAELLITFDAETLVKKMSKKGVSRYPLIPEAITCEVIFEVEGKPKIARLIASRLYDRKGRLIGAIQIAHDVTLERSMERYMSHLQRMEALGRLAAGIAHDFRNILMVIQNSMELIVRELKDHSQIARHRREIELALGQGVSLCRQLMGFARGGEEEREEKPRAISVNGVIQTLEKFVRRIFRENIHLQFELDPLAGSVKALPGQIDRILLNLFLNAQDAMPEGGTLLVKSRDVRVPPEEIPPGEENVKPGRFVLVTVKDTGVGMDEKTLQKIFEPFYSRKESGGHGLGLYIVWSELKRLGGFVRVESSYSLGTAFHVYFPVWEEEGEDWEVESVKSDQEEKVFLVESLKPRRVLVVEDNLALRNVLCEMLVSFGHKVEKAGSVKEALHLVERIGKDLDVVISDIGLPDGDGYEMIKEISRRLPHIKSVLMTEYVRGEVIEACRAENILLLYKPFSATKLQEIFASLERSDVEFLGRNQNRKGSS
ncbi:MAG: PAS domain S-box protein [Thermodesulforhabdaceae bacterium]